MENKIEDIRVICVKSIGPFVEGNEYVTDSRQYVNKNNPDDKEVLIVESETEDGLLNCYLVPLDKVKEHFNIIN